LNIPRPAALNSNATISTTVGAALTISGQISGSKSLTKDGAGP
jgi:hypothetical protein